MIKIVEIVCAILATPLLAGFIACATALIGLVRLEAWVIKKIV